MSIAGTRQQKVGYVEVHRLWCVDAYRDGCPGHADVEVMCKNGESVSMKGTKEHTKCSVCARFIQTRFRYRLVGAVPPDVPRLRRPDVEFLVKRNA